MNYPTPCYYLVGHEVYPAYNLGAWALWFEDTENRRIADDTFTAGGVTIRVSTVFIAIDHNFSGDGDPILFETMTFVESGESDVFEDALTRYRTFQEAVDGHALACALVEHQLAAAETH